MLTISLAMMCTDYNLAVSIFESHTHYSEGTNSYFISSCSNLNPFKNIFHILKFHFLICMMQNE